jgi:hypothetical protein
MERLLIVYRLQSLLPAPCELNLVSIRGQFPQKELPYMAVSIGDQNGEFLFHDDLSLPALIQLPVGKFLAPREEESWRSRYKRSRPPLGC